MTRKVRVKDLKDSPSYGTMLLCRECGGEYSANAADYFMARPDTVMTCCDEPMALVTKQTVYRRVAS